jgi:hypothetical protein
MPLIDPLERKLGHHAIPGLVGILAGLQAAVWVLLQMKPEFLGALLLDRTELLHGQIWRLVTWAFIPTGGTVRMFFTIWIMFIMSDGLDRAWGAFRVNLYLLASIFFVGLGSVLFGPGTSMATGQYLYWTLFLAFAIFYPDVEFLLFFILPFKVKYLALILAGLIGLDFIERPDNRLTIFLSLASFIIAFGPGFLQSLRQKGRVSSRRARFESAKQPDNLHLHRCHSCGKTERDDPSLDFRVGADGEDYCNKCRALKAAN